MDNNEIAQRTVQAAAAGYATTLALKGYDENMLKNATAMYVHPEQGMLRERANAYRNVQKVVLTKYASMLQRHQQQVASAAAAR